MSPIQEEELVRIVIAIAVGGLIGAEREFRDKAAGFRTLIFICAGAATFTMLSRRMATGPDDDPARIAAQIVSGVGFLGAGVILRDGGRVLGLTTAATIWLAAALGMAIGMGAYPIVAVGTVAALAVLWFFPAFEARIDRLSDAHTYTAVCPSGPEKMKELEARLAECGLVVRNRKRFKRAGQPVLVCTATGTPAQHDAFVERVLADPTIQEFEF